MGGLKEGRAHRKLLQTCLPGALRDGLWIAGLKLPCEAVGSCLTLGKPLWRWGSPGWIAAHGGGIDADRCSDAVVVLPGKDAARRGETVHCSGLKTSRGLSVRLRKCAGRG